MMKKGLFVTGTVCMLLLSGMNVQAAPKVMPDGTVFDAEFYAEKYPDVKEALGTDEQTLYGHYVTFGKAEGRMATASAPEQVVDSQKGVYKSLIRELPAFTAEEEAKYAKMVPVVIGSNDSKYLAYQTDYDIEKLAGCRGDYSGDIIYRTTRNCILKALESDPDAMVISVPIYFKVETKEDSDYMRALLLNLGVDMRKAGIRKTVSINYGSADGYLHYGGAWENGMDCTISCMVLTWDINER